MEKSNKHREMKDVKIDPNNFDLTSYIRKLQEEINPELLKWRKILQDKFLEWNEWLKKNAVVFQKFAEGLKKDFELLKKAHNRANYLLFEYDWPPNADWSVYLLPELSKINEKTDDKSKRQILVDRLVMSFFNREYVNKEIYENWKKKPCLENRMHILKPVIKAHVNQEYALSVPAILPQIEGLIIDSLSHGGHYRQKDVKRLANDIFSTKDISDDDALCEKFFNEVYMLTFVFGDTEFTSLHRNAILHGGNLHYDNEATSLRAILLLDFVVSRLKFVSKVNSDIYHVVGCHYVKEHGPVKGKRKIVSAKIENEFSLFSRIFEEKGKRACKRCIKPGDAN